MDDPHDAQNSEPGKSGIGPESKAAGGNGTPKGIASTPSEPNQAGKTVPESDLLALKRVHEEKVGKLQTELETLTGQVTSERAARTAAEERSKGLETLQTQLQETRQNLEDGKQELEKVRESALQSRRSSLQKQFGLSEERVKSLSEEQLALLEETLPSVAVKAPSGKGLDVSGAGGGDLSQLSSHDKIMQGLNQR